jgi:Zn-dependent protease/CBS domain-containing protein
MATTDPAHMTRNATPDRPETDPRARHGDGGSDGEERVRRGPLGGFRLGAISGIEIIIDWSLLLIFALVLVNLGAGVFPQWHPDWSAGVTWGVATVAALAFFASILVHELSHALVGRAKGITVRRITLFMFGGMAQMEDEARTPGAEFAMTIVGPLTSAAIGVVCLVGASLGASAAGVPEASDQPQQVVQALGPFATLLVWLGSINILLALFNLIPGFPLDGGRVLRAGLWKATGSLRKATRWASRIGQGFGIALIAFGITLVLGGGLGQGLWLILIGWFLTSAAKASYRQLVFKQALDGVEVEDVMRSRLHQVPPDLTLDRFVDDYVLATDQGVFPVVGEDGTLKGLVGGERARAVDKDRWPETPVSTVMVPVDRIPTVAPTDSARRTLDLISRSKSSDQVAVADPEQRFRGLVHLADLARWVHLNERGLTPS